MQKASHRFAGHPAGTSIKMPAAGPRPCSALREKIRLASGSVCGEKHAPKQEIPTAGPKKTRGMAIKVQMKTVDRLHPGRISPAFIGFPGRKIDQAQRGNREMKKWVSMLLTVMYLFSFLAGGFSEGTAASVVDLRVEGRVNPVGIDTAVPAFSWRMESPAVGARQQAWQVIVRDRDGRTVWDSGLTEGSESLGISYAGEALQPSSAYTWKVIVTDQDGVSIESEEASFTTSLLSDSFEAWDGARWIGAERLPLDAESKAIFHINADVTLSEGSKAYSFVLGAEDFRLRNAAFNPTLVSGENYVRVEFDFSEMTAEGGAKIKVYRVGYAPEDTADAPFATIEGNKALDAVLTADNVYAPHHVDIFCTASTLTFTVDGAEIASGSVMLNPIGSSNTYPNLNSVGFAMNPGDKAQFANYQIENGGRFARGILFDAADLAALIPELAAADFVADGGENGFLAWVDPSHDGVPYLKREIELKAEPVHAMLYLTAQGIYHFDVNGQRIAADEWFNPGSTEYDAILAYNMYDVTGLLTPGVNTLSAVLGEGWWTGMATFECQNNNYYGDQPALMAKLDIRYADGTEETVVTDENWLCATDGPVQLASLFQGEQVDATREDAGLTWTAASVIPTRKQFAHPKLVTRKDDPVHVIRTLHAAQLLGEAKKGTGAWIYDMGENLVGVPEITIPAEYAKAGETLTVRYAEILYPELEEYTRQGVDGTLMVENLRTALATDFYTMKDGAQVFCPDLTFHGYRYIEITGLEQPLPAENVGMKVLSSLDATAKYESSNPLVNRLFRNIVNSTTGNYLSIPTDCPQRDERMGWTGDAQVYALSASYAANTYPFIRQWMDTVRADCGPTGLSSQYCPAFVNYDIEVDETIPHKGQSFGITWNCLVVTIPYNLYMQTGDRTILRENIDNICTYVDHLIETPMTYKDADKKKQTEPRLTGETGTLADHLARIPTDSVLLGNAMFIACLDEAAVMCGALGDTQKAETYRQKSAEAREAWNERFIDPETGKTRNAKGVIQDTQASYATPLRFGVISEANLERALAHYTRTIEAPELVDSDGLAVPAYSITTGFNATGNVLNALTVNGLSELAYRMFECTEYASWLYPVTQGATSIWERWNGYTNELGFNGNNGMNSFNHYSFGAVYEWIMAYQLGITAGEDAGYQHFVLQPTAGGSFTFAKGSYASAYGTIESGWTAENGVMTGYDTVVPANTSATLYLPMDEAAAGIPEGAVLVGETTRNGARVLRIELVAGSWHFGSH